VCPGVRPAPRKGGPPKHARAPPDLLLLPGDQNFTVIAAW
jgi:hypothetical protein